MDGLPSNYISDIVQDEYNFMWFGTRNGLVRFDGYSFKNFTFDPLDSLSISDNYVRCLSRLSDGKIFVGTYFAGFCLYDPETESFERYKHDSETNSLYNDNILDAFQDSNGIIWIGTWDGFDSFDPNTGEFIHYEIPGSSESSTKYVSSIIADGEGKLLLYGNGNKVCSFNKKSSEFEFIDFTNTPTNTILLNKGGQVFKDDLGNLWIGTEFQGVYKISKGGIVENFSFDNNKLPSNVIMDILQDQHGEIWIATDGGGLAIYNKGKNSFSKYDNNSADLKSLSSNSVYCLYETQPEIVWAGTYGGGICQFKRQKMCFQSYTNKPHHSNINFKSVLSFEQADNGKIWIGTDGGGLDLFNPANGSISNFNSSNSTICFDIIKSLHKQGESLWLGSYGSGVCLKSNNGSRLFSARENADAKSLSKPSVWSICDDGSGNVWFGLMDNALDVYYPASGTFKHFKGGGKENLPMGAIHVVFRDSKNRMWVGSETHGLAIYDDSSNTFVQFNLENSSGLKSNCINEIKEFNDTLWIGFTNGGFSKLLNDSLKVFKTYTINDGLAGNSVFGIESDGHGNLWISTESGISKFNTSSEIFRNFDVYDGLISNEFTYGASFKADNGFLYFGSVDGFVTFHPDSVEFNERLPEVSLVSVKIANQEVKKGAVFNEKVYYNKPVNLLKELKIGHEDYMVTLGFAAQEYAAPLKSKYAYKLEGFDDDWVYTNADQRQATYTNLPAGEYVFRVMATNNHGKWNKDGVSLKIIVLPPWWDSIIFKSFLVVFVLGFIGFGILVKTRVERKRRKELEDIVSIRTAELKIKNEELNKSNATKDKLFSIVSHDLRGPANSVEALSSMVLKHFTRFSDEDKLEALGQLNKASKALTGLVSTLFTWARLHTNSLNPVNTVITINDAILKTIDILELQAKGKSVQIHYEECDEDLVIFADKDMIETVLRNILTNAIKFTDNGGNIVVNACDQDDMIKITVQDNGIGMDSATLDSVMKGSYSKQGTQGEVGSGLGLVVCKDFAEANGGFLKIKSSPNIGSTFEIHLPKAYDEKNKVATPLEQ